MGPEAVIIISALYGAGAAGNIVGSTIYDLRELKKEKDVLRNPKSKKYRKKPLISIILPVQNSAVDIANCLDSIVNSTYKKYEIVVVDNASKDATAKTVQEFIKAHKKAKISLLKKRRKVGQNRLMADGLKKTKGELILALNTSETLMTSTLGNVSRHFSTDDINVLEPNTQIQSAPSIVSALDQLMNLMDARSKKINPLVNSRYGISDTGVVYKKDAFKAKFAAATPRRKTKKATDNSVLTIKYARDVYVETQPSANYRQLINQRYELKKGTLNNYLSARRPEAKSIGSKMSKVFQSSLFVWKELIVMLSPLALSLFAFLAFQYDQRVMFGIVWAVLAATMAYIVSTGEGTSLRTKLRLSLFIPVIYVLLYLIAFVEIISSSAYLNSFKSSKKSGSKKRKLTQAKAIV